MSFHRNLREPSSVRRFRCAFCFPDLLQDGELFARLAARGHSFIGRIEDDTAAFAGAAHTQ
jgi:hypothetical protein